MSELKPCPFCGESKLLYSGGCGFRYDDDDNQIRLFRVNCRTCKGRTGVFESLDEAVEAWNRRTNSTTIQPSELGTNLAEVGRDLISRQAALDALRKMQTYKLFSGDDMLLIDQAGAMTELMLLPSAQPEIIRCKDCIYYDPPHVENNGVRYEYDEMPADAFDALGTGLVNAEYGINIGGRCCVDYYCKNYSDDKRVFVREDNYCGRAERRTDGSD